MIYTHKIPELTLVYYRYFAWKMIQLFSVAEYNNPMILNIKDSDEAYTVFTIEILSKYLVFVLRPVTHPHFSSHPPINRSLSLFLLSSSSGWSFLPLPCNSASHLLDANLNVYTCVSVEWVCSKQQSQQKNEIVKTVGNCCKMCFFFFKACICERVYMCMFVCLFLQK